MGPFATSAASLPPAWLRALGLFLVGLAGWAGSLVLLGHDPALDPGARVAGLLTLLGMLLPGWLHEARVARSERAGELRRVYALMETTRLPVLARGDAPGPRGTRSLPLLAADLPLPVYEAAIGAPGGGGARDGDPRGETGPSPRAAGDPAAGGHGTIRGHGGDGLMRRMERLLARAKAA